VLPTFREHPPLANWRRFQLARLCFRDWTPCLYFPLLDLWRWRRHIPLKRREPLSVMRQKNRIFPEKFKSTYQTTRRHDLKRSHP